MSKRRLKGSAKSIETHIDPGKEEQLKLIKLEAENKFRQILKLIKSIKQAGKDGNARKKSDLIQLTEDFHQHYESLYALYDNLRGEIRKKVYIKVEDGSLSSPSSSDTEMYFSPKASIKAGDSSSELPKIAISDVEDTVLKDILTSTSEVKETLSFDPSPSSSQVPESGEVIKDVRVEGEQPESVIQKLAVESASLKDKLTEKEEELLSITKKYQLYECERLDKIEKLEGQVANLKLEVENLSTEKKECEDQVVTKSSEAEELRGETSRLEAQNLEFLASLKKNEENESRLVSTIDRLTREGDELKEQLFRITQEGLAQTKGSTEQLNNLQHNVLSLRNRNIELESLVERKSQEVLEFVNQIDDLKEKLKCYEKKATEEKEGFKVQVKDLEFEVSSLSSRKSDLEEQITSINNDAQESRVKEEELHGKISKLEKTLMEKEAELSSLEKRYEAHKNETSDRIKSLEAQVNNLQQDLENLQAEKSELESKLEKEKQDSSQSLTQMEKKIIEFTNKIADQQQTMLGLEDIVDKLRTENKQIQAKLVEFKTNFQAGERKIEEMAEDFRKQFEDNLRILSRRIRVAEQLHVENKEWYMKTRTVYEKENKDLKNSVVKYEVGIRSIKDMSLTANNMLISLDKMALKFEECTANFLNRISKVSCELQFAKDWVMRKNKAISLVKDDLDCVLVQLDEKEAEILLFREKVWKSENRVRELEKIVKEKEDSMLSLKEEKREAIRQLCVWIDYHRSRSDYYKKTLYDLTVGSRRAS